ncbi:hypothetical protein N7E02_27905 [Aliirhizobium terrae]|jgi:hypothetical protein|uniref:DUF6894 family protein n=1 Tax=Terrirhizobium terrae TaxID=2926709 RepID=UPI002576D1CA|nr:hypothetical protein [Rhizobium sp. CC-CFT758]WJH40342.1 hypothetical protein N7E02_27905 [Rhizobium sp. CC-CFT758]
MPRYFFHIQSAGHRYDDKEGSEFQNNEAALSEAAIAARELSADRLKRGLATDEGLFEVEDASGSLVGTVPFPRTSG